MIGWGSWSAGSLGRRGVKNQTAVFDEDGDDVARVGCQPSEKTARVDLLKEVGAVGERKSLSDGPFWSRTVTSKEVPAEKVRTPMLKRNAAGSKGATRTTF